MQVGKRGPEPVGATIGIAVQLRFCSLERLERARERTERPFIRRKLHDPLEPELALHLFDRLTRLVRDDSRKSGPQQAGRNLHYVPGVSSDFFRQIHSAPPAAAAIEARAPLFSPA